MRSASSGKLPRSRTRRRKRSGGRGRKRNGRESDGIVTVIGKGTDPLDGTGEAIGIAIETRNGTENAIGSEGESGRRKTIFDHERRPVGPGRRRPHLPSQPLLPRKGGADLETGQSRNLDPSDVLKRITCGKRKKRKRRWKGKKQKREPVKKKWPIR